MARSCRRAVPEAASVPLKRRRRRTSGLSGARGLILSLRRVGTQAERDRAAGEAGAGKGAKVGGGGEPAARSVCGSERRSGFWRRRGTRRRQEPRRSERKQVRRAKVSLPSRASDQLERTRGQSAGDERHRNGRAPDLRRDGAGRRSGRGGGARRWQVARKGATPI